MERLGEKGVDATTLMETNSCALPALSLIVFLLHTVFIFLDLSQFVRSHTLTVSACYEGEGEREVYCNSEPEESY